MFILGLTENDNNCSYKFYKNNLKLLLHATVLQHKTHLIPQTFLLIRKETKNLSGCPSLFTIVDTCHTREHKEWRQINTSSGVIQLQSYKRTEWPIALGVTVCYLHKIPDIPLPVALNNVGFVLMERLLLRLIENKGNCCCHCFNISKVKKPVFTIASFNHSFFVHSRGDWNNTFWMQRCALLKIDHFCSNQWMWMPFTVAFTLVMLRWDCWKIWLLTLGKCEEN